MNDIFGPEKESPELEIFLRINNPYEAPEAIEQFKSLRKDSTDERAAIEAAIKEVVPISFLQDATDQ